MQAVKKQIWEKLEDDIKELSSGLRALLEK